MHLALGMLLAALPVAPFTSPSQIVIPSNTPVIETGIYRKANWLRTGSSGSPSFMSDTYIGTPRRRGNIVSFYEITRTHRAETSKLNRHTPNYGKGMFLPGYDATITRYDCSNDRYSTESPLWITDAWGDVGDTGGLQYPIDRNHTKWARTPGQVRIMIEGRPYWAVKPSMDPRHEDKPVEWISIRPGSYGASHIDYACTKL